MNAVNAANAIGAWAWAAAFACVAVMGYAIQRGATCTVAAVDEVLHRRSARRLLAMGEAALWVAGGLAVLQALGRMPVMPAAYALAPRTLAGGVLLGAGAWLAGACVFGAIARLGSGDAAYALVPVGYFAGCASVGAVFGAPAARPLAEASPLLAAAGPVALGFAVFAAWRLWRLLRGGPRHELGGRVWQPHTATAVIGLTFLATLLLAGAWAYTDLLAELARGMAQQAGGRLALFAALLGGAAWGGWSAGRWRAAWPHPVAAARCLAGGALMGWGTLLIPGSNDGLILVGMPLLRPYAWVAFATMCATIAAAMRLQRALRQFSQNGHAGLPRDPAA